MVYIYIEYIYMYIRYIYMVVSINLGSFLFVGGFFIRALLFGVYIWAPGLYKTHPEVGRIWCM